LFHYKTDHIGGDIKFNLGLYWKDTLIGAATFGPPRHQKKHEGLLDLRRFCCVDKAPKNTESYFLAKCMWWLKKNYKEVKGILTFADKTVGHVGTIYKATGFTLLGETGKSKYVMWGDKRYHMRSLTIDRPYSYRLREAIKTGEAEVKTGKPKLIYVKEF